MVVSRSSDNGHRQPTQTVESELVRAARQGGRLTPDGKSDPVLALVLPIASCMA